MVKKQTMSKKIIPSYKLLVNVNSYGESYEDVLCEIYLPRKSLGPIELVLLPDSEQYGEIARLSRFGIEGVIKGYDGQIQKRIVAREVYVKSANQMTWTDRIKDNVIGLNPFDLEITSYINDSEKNDDKLMCDFWISPSEFLYPSKAIIQSYTGEVEVKNGRSFSFLLPNNIELLFDTDYKYFEDEDQETITIIELFARFESKSSSFSLDSTLSYLDDFLLLTSFSERKRISCIGWSLYDGKTLKKFYRRNISVDNLGKDDRSRNGLIDLIDFENFIKTAFSNYIGFSHNNLIKQAIFSISYQNISTIEESFKSLFTAVESIVLFFHQEHDEPNKILMSDDWSTLKKEIVEFIKKKSVLASSSKKEDRKLIYEKLGELNRISFSTAFEKFCERYSTKLDDLWPLTKSRNGITLKGIRDKLIHGEEIDESMYVALMNATEHLRWTAERMILDILGWSIEKSEVSENYLSRVMYPYKYVERYKEILSKW